MDETAFNRNRGICVHSWDLVGANPGRFQLVRRREVVIHKDHVTNLMIQLRALEVLALQAQVRLQLPVLRDSNDVSDDGNVQHGW